MAEEKAQTSSFDATCPSCGQHPVTLVTIGTPKAPIEKVRTADATVTVSEGLSFLSCERCKHSWHLPASGSA